MFSRKADSFKWQMMELSDGITTSNGNWYHITTEQIKKYVPGLLTEYPLEDLVRKADDWLKSADGLSLFLYFILVYCSVTSSVAAVISMAFFLFWYFNTSAFVTPVLSPVMKVITNDGVVYMVTAFLLIGISFNDTLQQYGINVEFQALWYGIALFFLFKVGLLRLLIRFMYSRRQLEGPQMQDRILNMLLIRYGMKTGTLTRGVQQMQDELIKMANYHKTRKKE